MNSIDIYSIDLKDFFLFFLFFHRIFLRFQAREV